MAHLPDPTHKGTAVADTQSLFADSAIGMDGTTSTDHYVAYGTDSDHNEDDDHSISDRLQQISAIAWAYEEDHTLSKYAKQTIGDLLSQVERLLGGEDLSHMTVNAQEQPLSEEPDSVSDHTERELMAADSQNAQELQEIQASLATTVASMRLRQQEQRHLHELTAQRLRIEQLKTSKQDECIDSLHRDIAELRREILTIRGDKDQLCEDMIVLESEAAKSELAIEAMTRTVISLEGWLDAAQRASSEQAVSGRYMIGGRGRFRGRIYVNAKGEPVRPNGTDGCLDLSEFYDGLKAWLRGFKDVEEELSLGKLRPVGKWHSSAKDAIDEMDKTDDWHDTGSVL